MIDYSDIFRSQAESLNTAGMEGILRAADVPREVAQNFSVKEIVLNMLSGDAAVNQEKVLDLLKTMLHSHIFHSIQERPCCFLSDLFPVLHTYCPAHPDQYQTNMN